jgi:hypothetical protein
MRTPGFLARLAENQAEGARKLREAYNERRRLKRRMKRAQKKRAATIALRKQNAVDVKPAPTTPRARGAKLSPSERALLRKWARTFDPFSTLAR